LIWSIIPPNTDSDGRTTGAGRRQRSAV